MRWIKEDVEAQSDGFDFEGAGKCYRVTVLVLQSNGFGVIKYWFWYFSLYSIF